MPNLQEKMSLLQMYKQQQLGENVDFLIQSGDKMMFVHSLLVRFSNLYLRSLLLSSCVCNQPTVLILDPSYASVLHDLVSFFYTGCTENLPADKMLNLQRLVTELGFNNISQEGRKEPIPSVLNCGVSELPVLKLDTLIKDQETKESYKLSFPESRHVRVFSNLINVDQLNGFHGRVQGEYNNCPVGPYVGPFDQNESLNLNLQLPKSSLTFEKYSEFVHPDMALCRKFSLSHNYLKIDDLEKIDALETTDEMESDDEIDSDEEEKEKIVYTCFKKKCHIPCPCSPCSTQEPQCKEHCIKHVNVFNEKNDAMLIRSREEFCIGELFFNSSYLIKYSGIPINCATCRKDLIHHKAYHFAFHEACKFCIQNWFKLRAKNASEFNKNKEMEEHYMNSVCPYCNKKFCEPYFVQKHIEYEHGTACFLCENCSKSFQSKQALDYHKDIHHSEASEPQKCPICEKEFKSCVSLRNHEKYAHSSSRKYACKSCDAKFKQKKNLRIHYLNVHSINQYKEEYHRSKEEEKFSCEQCGSQFKQRKNLTSHIKSKHTNDKKEFLCEECSSKYASKKSLKEHIKLKHENEKQEFECPKCGKKFALKKTFNRHLLIHD